MPLSWYSELSWGPTSNAHETLPGALNLSTTASTTAYHSPAASYGCAESYAQSSTTGAGNTFDTNHSSIHGPMPTASTLPGSDGGAPSAEGFLYRWKPGVMRRAARSSKPQRLLTRHTTATVTPLLPTSEELLRSEFADVPVHQEFSPSGNTCDSSPASGHDRSGNLLSAAQDAAAVTSSRMLLRRSIRLDGSYYIQQVQRRCKAATLLPHPCDAHHTVTPDCAVCYGKPTAAAAAAAASRAGSRRSPSCFPDPDDASPLQLLKRQWHWPGGGNGGGGGRVVVEPHRPPSIANSEPFPLPHIVRGANDGSTSSSSSSSSNGSGGDDGSSNATFQAVAEDENSTHPSRAAGSAEERERAGAAGADRRSSGQRRGYFATPPRTEESATFAVGPLRRVPAAAEAVQGSSLISHVKVPVTPGLSSSGSPVSGVSSRVARPLVCSAASPRHHFGAETQLSANVSSSAATVSEAAQSHPPSQGQQEEEEEEAAQQLASPQPRVGVAASNGFMSVSTITSHMPRNESPLAGRPSNAARTVTPRSLFVTSTAGQHLGRGGAATGFTPEFVAAQASNTSAGGGGRDVASGLTTLSSPVTMTATTSPASPLVFRAMQPVMPSHDDSRQHEQQPQPQPSSSPSVSIAVHRGGDDAATTSLFASHGPEWAVEHKPLSQLRSRVFSFSPVGASAAVAGATLNRRSSPFAVPPAGGAGEGGGMASPSSGPVSFGPVRPTPAQQPIFSSPVSPISSAPAMPSTATATTSTAMPLSPPQLLPPALSGIEERVSPAWQTPSQPPPRYRNNPSGDLRAFPFASSPSSSSLAQQGLLHTLTPCETTAATTTTFDFSFPNVPAKSNSGGGSGSVGEADGSLTAMKAAGVSSTAASPTAPPPDGNFDEVQDTGVLLVVPAGVAVTSHKTLATDRFRWSTSAPPDAALAVVERRAGGRTARTSDRDDGDGPQVSHECGGSRTSTDGASPSSSLETVERVVTYFPVHADVMKKQGFFFAALFGDTGSPYVRSAPDEYVDLADLPRVTTETVVLHQDRAMDTATGEEQLRPRDAGQPEWEHANTAERCWRGRWRPWKVEADESGSTSSTTRQDAAPGLPGHLAETRADARPTCVPAFYLHGPGCDDGAFTHELWQQQTTTDGVQEELEGPQLTAAGVAQLIHYFYTGALPLFHNYEDIMSARCGVLGAGAMSSFAWQFAEVFSIGSYTNLTFLIQAMLNVLWRLLEVSGDVLPLWTAAVEWHLPAMQVLCEQWIRKHLNVFLRTDTHRGLWRGLPMRYVELLVTLRVKALREARELALKKAAAQHAPVENGSPNNSGNESVAVAVAVGAASTDEPRGESAAAAAAEVSTTSARAPWTTIRATPLSYGWPVAPHLLQPTSITSGGDPLLPPRYAMSNTSSSPNAENGSTAAMSALQPASPPPPPMPQIRSTSFPVSPTSRASLNFEASPLNWPALGRPPEESSLHSWSIAAHSHNNRHLFSIAGDSISNEMADIAVHHDDNSGDGAEEAGEGDADAGVGLSAFIDTAVDAAAAVATSVRPSQTTTTSNATSAAAAAAAPPFLSASPLASRPVPLPSMPLTLTPPWQTNWHRGSISSPAGSPTSGNNATTYTASAQPFRSESDLPTPHGATGTPSATPNTLFSTPLTFAEMDADSSPTRTAEHSFPAMRMYSMASRIFPPRNDEPATASEGQQQQHRRQRQQSQGETAGPASGASASRSGHPASRDIPISVPSPTSAMMHRSSYVPHYASPTSPSNPVSAASSPNLHNSFAAAAAASRARLEDGRVSPGPHAPPPLSHPQGTGFLASLSSTPRLRSAPSPSLPSTSWMVVPPTLQLLADGAWRIGCYGRLYTVEPREALEARQTLWLDAEQEQHREDRVVEEVALSEEELLERLWTWWTAYTKDAGHNGRSVEAVETAAMAAMLREVRLEEVGKAAVLLSSSPASASRSTLPAVLGEVRRFLRDNPPPSQRHETST
ncbi:hypothetical protein ABB37_07971 [Leptomonas pyrrhocoris]|uniref:Uncharacterized protein n=1 Tax=Leptomonas pyrrhocoris TaxID=157538 RepID=A0A0N0VDW9_LEPPY|nr:hypothetical protein ABB37_07971 [Leptomonas pyrrhocoris]KPA76224.1 hypothetical protein ABB37_07971 [Leptomonas pyrrhocoris]|eukprot:XP_015654663.1 hypothetical protein ABB37_07971 [Leptomonas pyrrhocoris]